MMRLPWLLCFFLICGSGLEATSGFGPSLSSGAGFQPQPKRDGKRGLKPLGKPLILSGNVVLEDDNPPLESVSVELLCNSQVRSQTYTAADGTFHFQVGGDPSTIARTLRRKLTGGQYGITAFTHFEVNRKSVNMSSCEIEVRLGGFEADSLRLGNRAVSDSPNVGTILVKRRSDVEGVMLSLNTLDAPRSAIKSYRKAQRELKGRKGGYRQATKELDKAIGQYPKFSAAWQMLGEMRLSKKDREGAREAFSKALNQDPQYIPPYLSLAALDFRNNHWEEVNQLTLKVFQLDSETIEAYYYHGVANYYLGELEIAKKSALKVSRSREAESYPLIRYLMGSIHVQEGNFNQAASEYRLLLQLQPDFPFARQLRRQLKTWHRQGMIQPTTDQGD